MEPRATDQTPLSGARQGVLGSPKRVPTTTAKPKVTSVTADDASTPPAEEAPPSRPLPPSVPSSAPPSPALSGQYDVDSCVRTMLSPKGPARRRRSPFVASNSLSRGAEASMRPDPSRSVSVYDPSSYLGASQVAKAPGASSPYRRLRVLTDDSASASPLGESGSQPLSYSGRVSLSNPPPMRLSSLEATLTREQGEVASLYASTFAGDAESAPLPLPRSGVSIPVGAAPLLSPSEALEQRQREAEASRKVWGNVSRLGRRRERSVEDTAEKEAERDLAVSRLLRQRGARGVALTPERAKATMGSSQKGLPESWWRLYSDAAGDAEEASPSGSVKPVVHE
ncbi:hypothetical protein KIPB_013617 [Kipferlia bialata]|uniref:Uncharacterized protein n=1 Tax=Kipferlia bialata TaxID=797122 RepID=A0A9K3GP09_9EUKA|nr:hypothetical protein KIPB_013617 [Kipferlia bialata]|eukprot:g13617.t1